MTTDQLLQLQEQIETAKNKKAQLEGEKKAILNRLKEEWGCKTTKQAEEKIEQMQEDISKLEEEIQSGLDELEDVLN